MQGAFATAPCRTRRRVIDVVLPPAPEPGVCARCRGPARTSDTECWCCRTVGERLGPSSSSGPPVWPLAVARRGDVLHRAIRLYKDGASADARRHFSERLARLLDELVQQCSPALTHALCDADLLAVVPSTTRGTTLAGGLLVAPFEEVVQKTQTLSQFSRVGFTAAGGRARHLAPDAAAFAAEADVAGRTVALVDDAWVTGSRVRSAAAALEMSGARVAALVVLARIVDVDACRLNQRWWLELGRSRPG